MLAVLKVIAAIATLVTGLLSLLRPTSITAFTGLQATGPRGITEIRAILGAFFVGLGVAGLLWGGDAYRSLGLTYLVVGVVRGVSMVWLDHSIERSNVISLVVELVLGVVLVI